MIPPNLNAQPLWTSSTGPSFRTTTAVDILQAMVTGQTLDGRDLERLASTAMKLTDALIAELRKETK